MVMKTGNEDNVSQGNRSTTTTGGGLASRIGLAMSRILAGNEQDDDDVKELVDLLQELNAGNDLVYKLTNTSKITKLLSEVDQDKEKVKDYRKEVGKAKSEFGRLGFQSKLRLELKSMKLDPRVSEIIKSCQAQLEELQREKDDEIEEFQEEHAE